MTNVFRNTEALKDQLRRIASTARQAVLKPLRFRSGFDYVGSGGNALNRDIDSVSERLQRDAEALASDPGTDTPATIPGEGGQRLSAWFNLSYASFLTLPRILMEAMPDEWQGKMAALLHEFDDAFPETPIDTTRVQNVRDGKLVKMPDWVCNYRHPDQTEIERARGGEAI